MNTQENDSARLEVESLSESLLSKAHEQYLRGVIPDSILPDLISKAQELCSKLKATFPGQDDFSIVNSRQHLINLSAALEFLKTKAVKDEPNRIAISSGLDYWRAQSLEIVNAAYQPTPLSTFFDNQLSTFNQLHPNPLLTNPR